MTKKYVLLTVLFFTLQLHAGDPVLPPEFAAQYLQPDDTRPSRQSSLNAFAGLFDQDPLDFNDGSEKSAAASTDVAQKPIPITILTPKNLTAAALAVAQQLKPNARTRRPPTRLMNEEEGPQLATSARKKAIASTSPACKKSQDQAARTKPIVMPPSKKKHQCEYCHKYLNTKSKLERHIRIHTGKKPFECSECGTRFNQKSSCSTHIKHVHKNRFTPQEIYDNKTSTFTRFIIVHNELLNGH